jgi:hypothetical protein
MSGDGLQAGVSRVVPRSRPFVPDSEEGAFCFSVLVSGSKAGGKMAPKAKRRSVMDALRDLLDKLNGLGPLLKPKTLQPIPLPVRDPNRRRR